MTSALAVRNLTVEFDSGGYTVRPLQDLTFDCQPGELVVLLGPSGCGKTTLLSCLAGLLTPTSGAITVGELDVTSLRGPAMSAYRTDSVGVVFQAFNLIASMSARANVMVPMQLAGRRRREARARADELLARVGLSDRAHHRPSQLSGGQQQRVAIARALVHDPSLILADEPTAHLDHIQVEGILRLIRELADGGRLVVVSTHDDRITHIADRVVELAPNFSDADRPPETVSLSAGEVLFEQGDRSGWIYTVESGSVEVFRRRSDGTVEPVTVIGAGRYFGELGPLLNLPRSASARAAEDCVLTAHSVRMFRRAHPELSPAGSLESPE